MIRRFATRSLLSRVLVVLVFAVSTLWVLPGCHSDKPKTVFDLAQFYVRYVEDTKELQMEARFRNDSVPVTLKGEVMVNDKRIQMVNTGPYGIKYKYTGKAPFKDVYTFQWPTPDDRTESYTFKVGACNNLHVEGNAITNGEAFTIKWNGKPLVSGENMEVQLQDGAGYVHTVQIVGPTADSSFTFRKEAIPALAKGKGNVQVIRKISLQDKAPTRRIMADGEFYSVGSDIMIK